MVGARCGMGTGARSQRGLSAGRPCLPGARDSRPRVLAAADRAWGRGGRHARGSAPSRMVGTDVSGPPRERGHAYSARPLSFAVQLLDDLDGGVSRMGMGIPVLEIQNLLSRYGELVDEGDFAGV